VLDAFPCQEFELPSTWIKEVPKKGFLEVHYHTDHISDETIASRSKRGDNFDVRVKWFKRTLCYTDGVAIVLVLSQYTSACLQRCRVIVCRSRHRREAAICITIHLCAFICIIYSLTFLRSWIGMVIEDDEYKGIKREDMPAHRNWTVAPSFHAMRMCILTIVQM